MRCARLKACGDGEAAGDVSERGHGGGGRVEQRHGGRGQVGDVSKDVVERGEVRGALEQGCGGGDVVLEDVVVGTWWWRNGCG